MMFDYDVTDEAVLEAPPSAVYEALLDEFDGRTRWWCPGATFRREGHRAAGEVGALHEITSRHGRHSFVFSLKTVEVRRNELIRARYVRGGVRGEVLWKLIPQGDGTRVSYRWRVRPKNLINWALAKVIDAPRVQSAIMQQGFDRLSRHLAARREGPTSR